LFRAPISLVSLVDPRVQWFKSAVGTDLTQTSRASSFCGHAILGDGPFVVHDTLADERFRDNPLVTGQPHVRFYAGQPLHAPDGSRVGTLCVLDTRPRRPRNADLAALVDLAQLAEIELRASHLGSAQEALIAEREALRRRSMLDPLTRSWNRAAVLEVLEHELVRAQREHQPVAIAMVDLDHFKRVNDTLGHPVGDRVLARAVGWLRGAVRPYDSIGRYGGEEFLVVLPHCDLPHSLVIAERMRAAVASGRISSGLRRIELTVSIGVAAATSSHARDRRRLIAEADAALYEAKSSGRDRVVAGPVALGTRVGA
jgi:diguanylate cyclase (GGDEF)-like protein